MESKKQLRYNLVPEWPDILCGIPVTQKESGSRFDIGDFVYYIKVEPMELLIEQGKVIDIRLFKDKNAFGGYKICYDIEEFVTKKVDKNVSEKYVFRTKEDGEEYLTNSKK